MNTIVAGMYRDILDVFMSRSPGIAKLITSRDDEVYSIIFSVSEGDTKRNDGSKIG